MKKLVAAGLAGAVILAAVPEVKAETWEKDIRFALKTTSNHVYGSAAKNATVTLYKGKTKIGSTKVDNNGYFNVFIKPQKMGTVLTAYQTVAGKKKVVKRYKVTVNRKVSKQLSKKYFSREEKLKIEKEMYTWFASYAKKHKLAVTDKYYDHGTGSNSDWFAETPQGYVQMEDYNMPGYYAYPLHGVGGFVLYNPKSNHYGIEKDNHMKISGYNGYDELLKTNSNLVKYLLTDSGQVYEMRGTSNRNSTYIAPWTGYATYDAQGMKPAFKPYKKFVKTTNKDIQKKYTSVFKKYLK